jgi:hypothetical protein
MSDKKEKVFVIIAEQERELIAVGDRLSLIKHIMTNDPIIVGYVEFDEIDSLAAETGFFTGSFVGPFSLDKYADQLGYSQEKP